VRRPIQILLLVLAAAATAVAVAGPASAKTPCWQTLIDDWYDGRIDSVYPVACYREALAHMPEDVAQYSSLEDDINRALAAVIASGKSGGGSGSNGGGGTTDPTNDPDTSGSTGGTTDTTTSTGSTTKSTFHGGPKADRKGAVVVASGGRDTGSGPIPNAINSLGPDSADSVPVPLIVLGALSLLLLALGSAGVVARKMQTRRAAVRSGAKS
jgi:hypothetical protein